MVEKPAGFMAIAKIAAMKKKKKAFASFIDLKHLTLAEMAAKPYPHNIRCPSFKRLMGGRATLGACHSFRDPWVPMPTTLTVLRYYSKSLSDERTLCVLT